MFPLIGFNNRAAHLLRQAAEQEEALARCLRKKRLRPVEGPAAVHRLEQLRARVRVKTTAAASL